MKRLAGIAMLVSCLCACASTAENASDVNNGGAPAPTTASTTSPTPDSAPTSQPPITEPAPAPEVAHTGTVTSCPSGQRLDDADSDTWGECIVDAVAVNVWGAQAAAESAGLPLGTVCRYPDAIVVGATEVVTCPVVNTDRSEGTWSFVLASDMTLASAAAFTETRAAPVTTPPTLPPPPPPVAVQPAFDTGTDPRFGTCKEAKSHGYGPYYTGQDAEYGWYQDRDHDGIVCE